MSIRSHVRALGALACLALVAGCGSSTSDGSSPTSSGVGAPATHPRSATPTTTASASPTSNSTAAGAPGVPEAARQHTKAGAIAFANYYTDKVNALGLKPKKGVLEPLSQKGCKTCRNFISTVAENVAKRHHFDGPQMIRVRTYSPYVDAAKPAVWVVMKSPEVHIVDSSGRVVRTFPRYQTAALVFHLRWTEAGWRTAEAKGDTSVHQ